MRYRFQLIARHHRKDWAILSPEMLGLSRRSSYGNFAAAMRRRPYLSFARGKLEDQYAENVGYLLLCRLEITHAAT
jgi:hypothetical protein